MFWTLTNLIKELNQIYKPTAELSIKKKKKVISKWFWWIWSGPKQAKASLFSVFFFFFRIRNKEAESPETF
jgi:hypothetical protein